MLAKTKDWNAQYAGNLSTLLRMCPMSYDVVTLSAKIVPGLQLAVLKFPTQQIKIPYFVSCPWCHLMSFRLVCNGNLKSPRKNLVLNKEKKIRVNSC